MTDVSQREKLVPIDVIEEDNGGATAVFPAEKTVNKNGDRRAGRDPDDEGGAGDESDDGADGGSRNSRRGRARRERSRQAKEQREQQIEELSSVVMGQQRMLESLTRGQHEQALRTLQGEGEQAKTAHAEAQRRYAEAIDKGDGKTAAEAQVVMRNAETYYGQVSANFNRIAAAVRKAAPADDDQGGGDQGQGDGQPRQRQPRVPKLNETAEDLKADFLDKHPWIDLSKRDATTAAILTIDAEIIKDFKPDTQDYWDELAERLREELPHKFEGNTRVNNRERERERDNGGADRRRGGPPLGGGGDRNRDGGNNRVQLTPEMVKALDEANIPLTGGDESIVKRRNRILSSWKENAPQR